MDASHFVMGGFAGRVWSTVRKYVRTASGRSRQNVLGALNFVTKQVETVTNTTYITSVQVVELLEKLAQKHIGAPIKVILDNAAYQRCNFVKENAQRLGIDLIYLPTYSPNLNLIERIWKFVKGKVLNAVYHDTFAVFCDKITDLVSHLHEDYEIDMASLISSKFHIHDHKNVIP